MMAESLRNSTQGNEFGNAAQFLGWLGRYADCDAEVADAVQARKDLRAEIKAAVGKEGLIAFDRARKDADMSGELREKRERAYRQFMAWQSKPIGFQASMDLPTDEAARALNVHELKRIDNEGEAAGKAGRKRDSNPWTPGTEGYQRWDTAWMRGQAEIAETLANQPQPRRGRPPGAKDKNPRKPRLVHAAEQELEKEPEPAA